MTTEYFTLKQIFQAAIQIENRAIEFYQEAANVTILQEVKNLFINLSSMEEGHKKVFKAMQKKISKTDEIFDPGSEMGMLLSKGEEIFGWEGKAGPFTEFSGISNISDILETAQKAEKDTIQFYSTLKQFSTSMEYHEKLDQIIIEEKKHLERIGEMIENKKVTAPIPT